MKELALTINEEYIKPPPGIPVLPSGFSGMNQIFAWIFGILFFIAIILTLIYLIWGGIDYITSEGNKDKRKSAKDKLTYSIIGLVIVFLAFFIVAVLGYFFGMQLI